MYDKISVLVTLAVGLLIAISFVYVLVFLQPSASTAPPTAPPDKVQINPSTP